MDDVEVSYMGLQKIGAALGGCHTTDYSKSGSIVPYI